MEGARGRFDSLMNSLQSSYDIVSSNRKELAGGLTRSEEQQEEQSQPQQQEEQK